MKKILAKSLALFFLLGFPMLALAEVSPPLSNCAVNKTTSIYWGKGEQYPVLGTLSAGTALDVYEYDADWALVLYKTFITYNGQTTEQSFYGYLSRSHIDCEPPLTGEASPKADTGPGRSGKRANQAAEAPASQPNPEQTQGPEATTTPEEIEEQLDDFDWIIRTNGLQSQQVNVMGVNITCSFSLMAQKAGGSAASSNAVFNQGVRTPYAATAFYAMKMSMQDALDELGGGFLTGEGGIDLTLQTAASTFYIDTGAEDFALVSFTLPMKGSGTLDPSLTGDMGGGTVHAYTGNTTVSGESSLTVRLKKVGNGYQFVLMGMKPGGGDLEFPAVLEKTFADPDRYEKEAEQADARRKKAEAERDQHLEEMKKKAEERTKAGNSLPPPSDDFVPAPLVTDDFVPAPLVTDDFVPAPLVTDDFVPALLVEDEDEAPPFPKGAIVLQRREAA